MKQEQLADYQDLKDLKETDPETFYEQMRASGFKNERDLEETIKTLQYGIKRIQNKLDGLEEPEMEVDKVRRSNCVYAGFLLNTRTM